MGILADRERRRRFLASGGESRTQNREAQPSSGANQPGVPGPDLTLAFSARAARGFCSATSFVGLLGTTLRRAATSAAFIRAALRRTAFAACVRAALGWATRDLTDLPTSGQLRLSSGLARRDTRITSDQGRHYHQTSHDKADAQ